VEGPAVAEADQVLAVVVEAAARAAAGLQAGAAARAAPEVCGKPVNQARRLAEAPAGELVQAVLAAGPELAAVAEEAPAPAVGPELAATVEAAQAVAVDLVVADRVVVEEESADRAEDLVADRAAEQVEAGLVVVAAREAEQAVEQAVVPALSVSQGDG
jgi:hypothetical protein